MSIQTHTSNTEPSYHARERFRERIDTDPSLIESCWYGGTRIEAPKRDYDLARVYEGPLCTDCVLLAVESDTYGCEWLIRTVLPAETTQFEYCGDQA